MAEIKEQLADQLRRLDALLFRTQMRRKVKDSTCLNPHKGQGRVLSLLKLQPEMGQKELGYLLDMSKQALAELLRKLEKAGYITREPSPKDRRASIIKLTEAGQAVAPDAEKEGEDDVLEAAVASLKADEQAVFADYLGRVIASLEEQLGSDNNDYGAFVRERFFAQHGGRRRPGGHHGGFPGGRGGFGGYTGHHGADVEEDD